MGEGRLRIAAVQAGPSFLDRDRTVEKAVGLIGEAGRAGARLVVFGECFLPGHPVWLHLLPITHPRSIELTSGLVENAIRVPGPEADAIVAAARDAGAIVVLGFVERPDPRIAVVHDSQLIAGPDGVIGVRRKVAPAVGERVLFAPGGRESICTFDTPWGAMSTLVGGENSNPLLTAALRSSGAKIHVAAWPPHFNKPGLMGEVMTITGRAIAYQNTAWVIAVAGATSPEVIDRLAMTREDRALLEAMADDPASAVWAPRGALHAGPHPGGEGILYADLDLTQGTWAQLVNRHYDRPDLLRLEVRGGTDGTSADAGNRRGEVDRDEPIRHQIRDRFGAALPSDDVNKMIPFVRGIQDASAELAAAGLDDPDPRRTAYADDPRPAP